MTEERSVCRDASTFFICVHLCPSVAQSFLSRLFFFVWFVSFVVKPVSFFCH